MANELQNLGPTGLSNNVTGVTQQAEKIVNVNKAESITTGNITNNMFFAAGDGRRQVVTGNFGTSHEYYSLFVQLDETFYENGYFYVRKDRALNTLTLPYIGWTWAGRTWDVPVTSRKRYQRDGVGGGTSYASL